MQKLQNRSDAAAKPQRCAPPYANNEHDHVDAPTGTQTEANPKATACNGHSQQTNTTTAGNASTQDANYLAHARRNNENTTPPQRQQQTDGNMTLPTPSTITPASATAPTNRKNTDAQTQPTLECTCARPNESGNSKKASQCFNELRRQQRKSGNSLNDCR